MTLQERRKPIIGLEFIDNSRWTAGGIYMRNVVYCLASLPQDEWPEIRLLDVRDAAAPIVRDLTSFPFVSCSGRQGKAPGLSGRLGWLWRGVRRRYLARVLPPARERAGLQAIYPAVLPKQPGTADIHWIPDLQHLRLPQMFSEKERTARDASMRDIADKRGVLVLSSETVRHDFEAAFPNAGISIRVWRFCSTITEHEQGGADPVRKYALPEKFLYLPNQYWQHKNHITAFRAMRRLKDRGLDIPLVCTGNESDYRNLTHIKTLRAFLADNGLTQSVYLLGLVPRADQMQIFRHAAAVLQPSLFEGWSTVVEDVKTVGRPIVVSDIPVHREQLSEEEAPIQPGTFFEPENDAQLADIIAGMWPTLLPGPDDQAQAAAAARNDLYRRKTGRAFLDIVRDAIALEQRT